MPRNIMDTFGKDADTLKRQAKEARLAKEQKETDDLLQKINKMGTTTPKTPAKPGGASETETPHTAAAAGKGVKGKKTRRRKPRDDDEEEEEEDDDYPRRRNDDDDPDDRYPRRRRGDNGATSRDRGRGNDDDDGNPGLGFYREPPPRFTATDYAQLENDTGMFDDNDPLKAWILNGEESDIGKVLDVTVLPPTQEQLLMMRKRPTGLYDMLRRPANAGIDDMMHYVDPLRLWILNGRQDDMSEVNNVITLPPSYYGDEVGQGSVVRVDAGEEVEDAEFKRWMADSRGDPSKAREIFRLPTISSEPMVKQQYSANPQFYGYN